jgi:hypothetical protein
VSLWRQDFLLELQHIKKNALVVALKCVLPFGTKLNATLEAGSLETLSVALI